MGNKGISLTHTLMYCGSRKVRCMDITRFDVLSILYIVPKGHEENGSQGHVHGLIQNEVMWHAN